MKNRLATTVLLLALLAPALAVPRPAGAASASLYLSPSSKTVAIDETFTVAVYVRTDSAVNAAEATVNFPNDLLKANTVSKSGIFTLWTQDPKISNTAGTITFSGGLPSPGYKGNSGKLITVTFAAKKAGKPKVTISGGSVLANDGVGTNILTSQGSATYTINEPTPPTNTNTAPPPTNTNTRPPEPTLSPPSITAGPTPDENKWYSTHTLEANWTAGAGVEGYSLVFDQQPGTIPPETIGTTDTSIRRDDLTDGVWYLHIRAKYAQGWSSTRHFKAQLDATPPEVFTIDIIGDPQLNFAANDSTSGVERYELSLDGGTFEQVSSPYQTPELSVGDHTVTVRAYDKAGNVREASATFSVQGYPQPVIIDLTPVLVGSEPLILRGYANAQDSIRLTVGDVDFGPFPVADYQDGQPPQPAPEGKVAWKIEVFPLGANQNQEFSVQSVGPDGKNSNPTTPVKIRVLRNHIRIFGMILPLALVLNVLMIGNIVFLAAAVGFAVLYFRHRRRYGSSALPPNLLQPVEGRIHQLFHRDDQGPPGRP